MSKDLMYLIALVPSMVMATPLENTDIKVASNELVVNCLMSLSARMAKDRPSEYYSDMLAELKDAPSVETLHGERCLFVHKLFDDNVYDHATGVVTTSGLERAKDFAYNKGDPITMMAISAYYANLGKFEYSENWKLSSKNHLDNLAGEMEKGLYSELVNMVDKLTVIEVAE